jgi:exonuclease VII large subunit
MTTVTDTRQPEMGLDFDKVWAVVQEIAKQIKETNKETDRKFQETAQKMREASEETDRKLQETAQKMREASEETDRKLQETARLMQKLTKETNKQIGDLGGRFGELAEHLVAPGIVKKFNALGYGFTRCSPSASFEDASLDLALEIDLFLENGDCAMSVEVKANLKTGDVKDHMNRMEKLRRYASAHKDSRKFYGAVAGAVISKEVREFALKTGFYVVAQSGDTMTINVPEGFKPKAW